MKKAFISFFNTPALVAVVCLVIAVAIGVAMTFASHSAPAPTYVRATTGSISVGGTADPASGVQHLSLGFLTSGRIQSVSVKVDDVVKKGDILAALDPENTAGAVTQARGAYAAAAANYQKVVNGATGPAIDVAHTAVASAQTNLTEVTQQQNTLVVNARRKLYSDNLIAESSDIARRSIAPTISGAYDGTQEGEYALSFSDINVFQSNRVNYGGLENGTAKRSDLPQPLGTHGLYVSFPDVAYNYQDSWTVQVPNVNGTNYASNLNAYQSALQTHDQAVAQAQAALTQAQASLTLTAAAARPEDVAAAQAQMESAQGALQIAQAAYDSRIIRAPGDGTVTAVHVSPGQIAAPNAPAIELSGTAFAKDVAVMIPSSALITRDGKTYVHVRGTRVEKEVTVGISDDRNTEVTSGLSVGDEVAVSQ